MVSIDQRAGKWLVTGLIASTAVNLFLGGLMLGRDLRREPAPPPAMEDIGGPGFERRGPLAAVGRLTRHLSPEEREVFQGIVRQRRGELAAAADGMREAQRRVREALAADPYDRTRLEAALEQLKEHRTAVHAALQRAVVEAIEQLPPDARRRMATHPRQKD
jgi:uncharacterized membrane protein